VVSRAAPAKQAPAKAAPAAPATAVALTAEQALALRLTGQFLDRPVPAGRALEVCAAMCGAQAQVGTAARLSLSARVAGLSEAALLRALHEERTLVKTWTVRGTLHLVPSTDLPLWVAAMGPVRGGYARRYLERMGLSTQGIDRLSDDIVEALADGPMTRKEIAARVGDAHGPKARRWLEHSWGGVFHFAVQEGRVCFGPSEGSRITFARTDRWLGSPVRAAERGAAEAEIARRFLLAYGPATVRDFAYWAGIYAPDAQRMWARIAGEARPVTVAGKAAFVHASRRLPRASATGPGRAAPHVRLLPHFDAFLLGHRDKLAAVDAARYKRVFRNAGWIVPSVLVDGRIVGTWSLERGGRGHVARVAAFGSLSPAARQGVAAEAERLARFWDEAVRVRYGPPARKRERIPWTAP
jgi:hypothetical protein